MAVLPYCLVATYAVVRAGFKPRNPALLGSGETISVLGPFVLGRPHAAAAGRFQLWDMPLEIYSAGMLPRQGTYRHLKQRMRKYRRVRF